MIYLQDADVTLHHGDALEVLRALPDESVHMCVTSPPFYGLRNYNVDGQIGLEETPEQWVEKLVAVFREVRRVLRADGTCWIEIGDSYCASQGGRQSSVGELPNRPLAQDAGLGTGDAGSWQSGATTKRLPQRGTTDVKPKDLIGAPWLLAFALRADGWYLRSEIIWSKSNPMPESVSDRPSTAHSRVFLLAKSARYFFDAEAVREPHSPDGRLNTHVEKGNGSIQHRDGERWPGSGRNIRSVWEIATEAFAEAHFATFPQKLVTRCILAGTSERGCCPECGAPWVREVEVERGDIARIRNVGGRTDGYTQVRRPPGASDEDMASKRRTTGWRPSCECRASWPSGEPMKHVLSTPVPATILDPFVGSGTTALVARKLGRRCIGIDLSVDYLEMAARRPGLAQQSLFATEDA